MKVVHKGKKNMECAPTMSTMTFMEVSALSGWTCNWKVESLFFTYNLIFQRPTSSQSKKLLICE